MPNFHYQNDQYIETLQITIPPLLHYFLETATKIDMKGSVLQHLPIYLSLGNYSEVNYGTDAWCKGSSVWS